MNLHGLRVLNTRPRGQAKEWSQLIQNANGISVECPCLEIRPTLLKWLQRLPELDKVDEAIFTSPNAVKYTFMALSQAQIGWPSSITNIAIGPGTARALRDAAQICHFMPAQAQSEDLLQLEVLQGSTCGYTLLFKGVGGRQLIAQRLAKKRQLMTLNVYHRCKIELSQEFLKKLWQDNEIDIILFTSQQAMRHFVFSFPPKKQDWLQKVPCLVLSDRLAKEAYALGFSRVFLTKPNHLIKNLYDYSQGLLDGA